MDPTVVVSHVTVIAIVGLFHKGGHGCDDIIVTVYVVHIQFVLCLVRALVHDDIVEVAGDDVQLVGRAQGHLELLPLRSVAKDAWRYPFEKRKRLLVCVCVCVCVNIQFVSSSVREREIIITRVNVQLPRQKSLFTASLPDAVPLGMVI